MIDPNLIWQTKPNYDERIAHSSPKSIEGVIQWQPSIIVRLLAALKSAKRAQHLPEQKSAVKPSLATK